MPSPDLDTLLLQRDQLKSQLAAIGDMRPGSLVPRFRKCGKSSCHCAKKGDPGHGPSFSLTRPVKGKTVTRVIPSGPAVERTRLQLLEFQRFRQLVRQLIEVSEQICDRQTRSAKAPDGGVKKNRARRPAGR